MSNIDSDWHLKKGVSIGLILVVLGQLILLITFFNDQSNRTTNLELWRAEMVQNEFNVKDGEILKKDVEANTREVNRIYVSLNKIQCDINAIAVRLGVENNELGG